MKTRQKSHLKEHGRNCERSIVLFFTITVPHTTESFVIFVPIFIVIARHCDLFVCVVQINVQLSKKNQRKQQLKSIFFVFLDHNVQPVVISISIIIECHHHNFYSLPNIMGIKWENATKQFSTWESIIAIPIFFSF